MYDPADTLALGGLERALPARPALHPGQRGRARDGDGARFTFCADCAPNDDAVRRSPRGTDLLLIEATLPRPEREGDARAPDAVRGRRARRRGRARSALVLTHFSDELDADWARAEAERGFGGAGRARPTKAPIYELGGVKIARPLRPITTAVTPATAAMDGVRLLSHRPSVLYKVEHLATEPADGRHRRGGARCWPGPAGTSG